MNNQPVFTIPQTIKEDTEEYQKKVKRFLNGTIDPVRFKGYRVPMGVYGQRGQEKRKEKYMVRVRAPGGVITKEQLEVLNELSKKYGSSYLHFTTRQDIQIHQVNIEETPEMLFELLKVGLSPRGGGGNTVRNIMNSSRAGVNPDEPFDTTPHSLALTEYLIKFRSSFNLPRKYKIAFSVTEEDEALATVNDLGFIAKKQNGKKGFKVYAAGGMGNQAEVALLLEEFIEENKIFYVAEAIKRFFDDYGDRSNKHKARLRFVRKRLGDEEFILKYKDYFREVLEEGLDIEEINCYQEARNQRNNCDSNFNKELALDYLYPEKVAGYYSLELRPPEGDIAYEELEILLELLIDEDLSIRTTNRQGLLIRGIQEESVEKLIKDISNVNSEFLIDNMGVMPIACKGASTCRLGLCLSPNLATEIRNALLSLSNDLQSLIPQIYISGCPNSCGQHLIGKIGFEGRAKRFSNKLVPHYSLLLGGNIAEDQSRYGKSVIDIPAKRIPDFLVNLANSLAADKDYNPNRFNEYLSQEGKDKIVELARKYTEVPAYKENPGIYKDWGREEDFTLAGRGPGECGAGVMDIIELDLETAKDNYQEAVENKDDEGLYKAIVSAARALLIIRGIDTDRDREVLSLFRSEFIDKGLVSKEKTDLLDAALDYKLGDITGLLDYRQGIEKLINRVEKLFNSLNAKLEFDLEEIKGLDDRKETKLEIDKEKNTKIEVADLRGVKCPMNFVKAKVAISPLDEGDILEIYLDEGEPIANVPESLASEGHKILLQEKVEEGYYLLRVKKN
ncbi:sulfurtransferase TusA family protein [Selenihalanaerobacter shriftii]|uniref:Sulfite reductase (Ferredoxin) n=1 Tax=Selenihalanaerobacter shriftii TaxID=142842 RepID=A0A1T4NHY4_9FIRM|nr:sulfurtransferase TusA family protein [Selenihalanaerobacter shriftii]SJZ78723.1 sulfite reductase (ferredoxin) [Selenihalanaerobacter shriftii]